MLEVVAYRSAVKSQGRVVEFHCPTSGHLFTLDCQFVEFNAISHHSPLLSTCMDSLC